MLIGHEGRVDTGDQAMSRTGFLQGHFHSAKVRSEMRALDLHPRRLPIGTMLVSVVACANAASVVAMLMSL
jgi:hypothetical protein